jgi:hypothetical protein
VGAALTTSRVLLAAALHQARSPSRCITPGRSTMRMRMPSMRIAEASPTPMNLRISSVLREKAPNTDTMISAAAVMTLEVRARPMMTASRASPSRSRSSFMRDTMNTS